MNELDKVGDETLKEDPTVTPTEHLTATAVEAAVTAPTVDTGIDDDDEEIEMSVEDVVEALIDEELVEPTTSEQVNYEHKMYVDIGNRIKELDGLIYRGQHGFLPTGTMKDAIATARKLEIDITNNKQKLSKELAEMRDALLISLSVLERQYTEGLDIRVGSEWSQGVRPMAENAKLMRPVKTPIHKYSDPMLRASANAGLSICVWWQLPHTGISVEIMTPTNPQLLDLERRMHLDKDKFGRSTNGIVFSSVETYTNDALLTMALECVNRTNAPDSSIEYLRSIINPLDLRILLLAVGHGLYPQGYPYVAQCTSGKVIDEEKGDICNHIDEGYINLSRSYWVDNAQLSAKQRLMLSDRTKKLTEEQLREYQEEFGLRTIDRSMPFKVDPNGPDVGRINFHVPTLATMISSGHRWIHELNESVSRSFGMDIQGGEREKYIHYRATIESVRQYAPWVKSITSIMGADDEEEEDFENNEKFLERISANDLLRQQFFEAVVKFISDSTISYIGIVNRPCPVCGEESAHTEKHPRILPLDVHRVFFTMVTRMVERQLAGQL